MLSCSSPVPTVVPTDQTDTADIASQDSDAVTVASTLSIDLNDFQWQNRLLLLFAPGEENTAYLEQLELFEAEHAAFVERDLLLFELLADGNSRWDERAIAPNNAESIRQQFGIRPDDFAVILIGKDGTQKRIDNQPVDPQLIFLDMDAMPMRQREMQQRA